MRSQSEAGAQKNMFGFYALFLDKCTKFRTYILKKNIFLWGGAKVEQKHGYSSIS